AGDMPVVRRTRMMLAGAGAILAALLVVARASRPANAGPYVPASESEVVEKLPSRSTDPAARREEELFRELQKDPNDLDTALELAHLDIEQARWRSDPRMLGRAQAALGPWWDLADPPESVLTLRATIRQSNHDFDGALADLDKAVAASPDDVQAWITRAVV